MDCNAYIDKLAADPDFAFSPLIIGEWTATRRDVQARALAAAIFQSPNHRGVDCNGVHRRAAEGGLMDFQSPNHRGVDCNSRLGTDAAGRWMKLSVP